MKILKSIISIAVATRFFFMISVECSALDLSLTSKEENYLFYYKSIRNSCHTDENENINCTKYLVRYDGLASKIAEIQQLAERKDYTSLKHKLEKGGVIITGTAVLGAGVYWLPFSVMLKILGVTLSWVTGWSTVCTAYNEVIEPTGKILGYITKFVTNLVKFITRENSTNNNNSFVGSILDFMCGNNANGNISTSFGTSFKNFLFGSEPPSNITVIERKEAEAFKKLLNEFYNQVKEKKFENNNVLIISMDFTDTDNIKSELKFDKTSLNLGKYPQKDEEYFKKWL